MLGNGLESGGRLLESLAVQEALLEMQVRSGADQEGQLATKSGISGCLTRMGRKKDALRMDRQVYAGFVLVKGPLDENTLTTAVCLANSLFDVQEFTELRTFLRERIPESRRTLGDHNFITLKLQHLLARSLLCGRDAADTTQEIVDETEQLLTDLTRTYRQIFGRQYPDTQGVEGDLETFRIWKAQSPFR